MLGYEHFADLQSWQNSKATSWLSFLS